MKEMMVKRGNTKTLMQWTVSKIRLILVLYLEQRTRPGLLFPVMIMSGSSGNSLLGLGRRCALDHSQVATSCQQENVLFRSHQGQCLELLLCILHKLFSVSCQI